jgi:hypothetical protein
MYKMCLTINGVKHCFDIPVMINRDFRPIPPNFPELELAITVQQLVDMVKPAVRDTELTKALTVASTRFIQQVQKELPKGVELIEAEEHVQPQSKVA